MKSCLLQLLATDGLRSVVGLSWAEPQLVAALRTCLREGLVMVIRPGLKPTGYSRREIPTDVAALTPAGRAEAERCLGRLASAASLAPPIGHPVGGGGRRPRLRDPASSGAAAL